VDEQQHQIGSTQLLQQPAKIGWAGSWSNLRERITKGFTISRTNSQLSIKG
jgi:hypothetical protein